MAAPEVKFLTAIGCLFYTEFFIIIKKTSELFLRSVYFFFTARRYASAVYAVVVCPSVRTSHAGIVSKRLNIESRKQRRTITEGL